MIWIILTFAALILGSAAVAVIQHVIQNRDYKRQLEGKIPIREAKENFRQHQESVNVELEAERVRQDAVNAANMMSGH